MRTREMMEAFDEAVRNVRQTRFADEPVDLLYVALPISRQLLMDRDPATAQMAANMAADAARKQIEQRLGLKAP